MKKLITLLWIVAVAIVARFVFTSDRVKDVEPISILETTGAVDIIVPKEPSLPLGLHVVPRLTDEFVAKYKYEDSAGFCVALKVNGQYFNVFRNEANGVSNDKKRGLTWCIPMNQISRGYNTNSPDYRDGSWLIYYDREYPVAKAAWDYWYVYNFYTREDFLSLLELEYSPIKEKVEYLDLFTSEFTN